MYFLGTDKNKQNRVIVFGGTSEGRKITGYLGDMGIPVTVCVATEYGNEFISETENIQIMSKRLTLDEIIDVVGDYELVIDATHPYAKIITKNIKNATNLKEKPYLRIIREQKSVQCCKQFTDIKQACEYLNKTKGKILVTTGSKDLMPYTEIEDYKERIYLRILPVPEALCKCQSFGFKSSHIICIQGPLSETLNIAMLEHIDAGFLITKDSGESGGLLDKIAACKKAGVEIIVIKRPCEEGVTLDEAYDFLIHRFSKKCKSGSRT